MLWSPSALIVMLRGVIRRQFLLVVLIAATAFGLGLAYLIITPAQFTATAVLLLDSRRMAVKSDPSQAADVGYDPARMESQVYVVRSDAIALSVIKQLHLADDPEFTGPGTVAALIKQAFRLFGLSEPASERRLMLAAAETFASRLTVRRIGLSYVLEISFTSHDPVRAADIANAVADAYIKDQLDARYQVIRHANGWMQDRMHELAKQSSDAQRAVVDFKAKNDIIDAGGKLTNDQRLSEINTQLVADRAQAAEAKAKLDRIEALLNSDSPDRSVDATVADTLHSEVITRLRSQYFDIQHTVNEWARQYGPNHLAVVRERNQMEEIRASILDELKRIAETYKSDYDIAKRRLSSTEAEVAKAISESQTTDERVIALRALDADARTYRSLYDNFLQHYQETLQEQSFPITEARIVAGATPPLRQSHPRPLLVLFLSLGGGLILAVGGGLLRDSWYPVFRSSSEIEDIFQLGCFGVLPLLDVDESRWGTAQQAAKLLAATPTRLARRDPSAPDVDGPAPTVPASTRRIVQSGGGPLWHVVNAPLSPFTETIRSIKLAVDHGRSEGRTTVVGITSALPHEGKSTVAGALALLMAQTGARTVLVDGDLRNPYLTRTLAPQARVGLLDVILEQAELDAALWSDESGALTFLPGATSERLAHSVEFLASARAAALIKTLRDRYDNVVVDLSPLTPVVDVRATGQLIDSYVLVVEWGRTRVDQVERALRDAHGVYDGLLGVVLNKARPEADGRKDLAAYHYYGGVGPAD